MSDVTAAAHAAPATTAAPAQAHTTVPTSPSLKPAEAKVADPKPAESKPATPDAYEVPVNGKPVKLTASEIAEMVRDRSIYQGGYKKLEEAASLRKEAQSVLDNIKDPKEAIKFITSKLPQDQVRAAFEDWYAENVIKPSEMTPEQRRIAELERENSDYKKFKEQQAQREEQEKQRAADEQLVRSLQAELIEFAKSTGLPQDKNTLRRVAYMMRLNESKGINATPELISKQVWGQLKDDVKSATQGLDGDRLIEVLGDELVKKIRTHDINRIRARRGMGQTENKPEPEQETQRPGKITVQEFKQRLRNWN
jgi:hypothetical protein